MTQNFRFTAIAILEVDTWAFSVLKKEVLVYIPVRARFKISFRYRYKPRNRRVSGTQNEMVGSWHRADNIIYCFENRKIFLYWKIQKQTGVPS